MFYNFLQFLSLHLFKIEIDKMIHKGIIDCMLLACHVALQSEYTLYSCLNVKEHLARNRADI